MRSTSVERATTETRTSATVILDGTGVYDIHTGIGFLDHMLEQLSRHSLIDLRLRADGDLHIDDHHTVEDSGYAVGSAIDLALGERRGIIRYGHAYAPMDETLTRVVLDLSNRVYLVWNVSFPTAKIGAFDTELVREWFQAFTRAAGVTLHVETLYGANSHHIAESCFKALAHALRHALALDARRAGDTPSTKGVLSSRAAANQPSDSEP